MGGGAKGDKTLNFWNEQMMQQAMGRSKQLYNIGKPAREMIFNLLNESLRGGDVLSSQFFNPVAKQIESQSEESKRRLMSSMPQGGSLDRGMIDLETARLDTRANASSNIRQGLFADALNTAFGGSLNPSMGFMGQGGNALGIMAQTSQAQQAAQAERYAAQMRMLGELGGAAGMFAGMRWGGGKTPTAK